jgi:hypothetical protein
MEQQGARRLVVERLTAYRFRVALYDGDLALIEGTAEDELEMTEKVAGLSRYLKPVRDSSGPPP